MPAASAAQNIDAAIVNDAHYSDIALPQTFPIHGFAPAMRNPPPPAPHLY